MDDDALEALLRWEAAGGEWRLLARRAGHTTVELCRCDGGEAVGRIQSDDPEFVHFVTRREPNSAVPPAGPS